MSFRDDEDRRLWEELASMDAADTSKPVPLLEVRMGIRCMGIPCCTSDPMTPRRCLPPATRARRRWTGR